MNYITFTAGNRDYKLRLTTRNIVELEKKLGCNPIGIFGNGSSIPTLTQMVAILHASLQSLEHGITVDMAYDIFDRYLEQNSMTDFLSVIIDIYKVSGIMREETGEEKNA